MKKSITVLTLALLLSFANSSYGQAPAEQPKDLKYIMELTGAWEGPATMKMGGQELHFNYYAAFKKVASGNGLDMHEWGDIPGMGKLDGNNLIGFDPFDGKIHWYSVDNLGTTHEHIGSFTDHDHYSMVHKSTREGKPFVESIEMTRTGKDKLNLKITSTTDGKEDMALSVSFSRKSSKSKVMAAKK